MTSNRKSDELLPPAAADRGSGVRLTQTDETSNINRRGRSTHPQEKSVRRSGATLRFDLTVECIRRHYFNEGSPLSDVLTRYADYFRLFGDFRGYVEFFLLEDLVTDDFSAVKFFLPFADFSQSPVPDGMAAYVDYRERAVDFIEARNRRIQAVHSTSAL
jgi:hypothetical protein